MTPDEVLNLLAPPVREWVERDRELQQQLPQLDPDKLDEFRDATNALSDKLAREFTHPTPDGVQVDGFTIPTRHGSVSARRYRRVEDVDHKPLPTQVWLHGGGFVMGSITEEINNRLLAARTDVTGVQIITIEYGLAPENPYPIAVQQTQDTLTYLTNNAKTLQVDTTRLGVGGGSAGAGIMASTVLANARDGGPQLAHASFEVPVGRLQPVGESVELYGDFYNIQMAAVSAFAYLPDPAMDDGFANPAAAEDLSVFPPTHILAAEYDALRDMGVELALKLQDAGVQVRLDVFDGQLHASSNITATSDSARRWHMMIAEELVQGLVNAGVNA